MTTSNDVANLYQAFQARFPTTSWTQPSGLAGHREALRAIDLDAWKYPSTFLYDDDDDRIDAYLTGLAGVEEVVWSCRDLGRLSSHVAEQLRRDRLAATSVRARNDPTYSAAQRDLHGLPPDDLIDHVRASLDIMKITELAPEPVVEVGVTTTDLARRMTSALRSYGLTEWYLEITANMTAKASVNGPMRRIRLRDNEVFTAADADRLIVHEIGGHVLRWANSQRQPEPWAIVPLGRTVPTEEGLAVCREAEFGLLHPKDVRRYQLRCLAVSVAAGGGIMDVIRAVSPYVDRAGAVEIAIRTKRGLLDPNAPGGSTKDWGYYDGYLRMKRLRDSSPYDYQLLSAVKWPAEELPLIRSLYEEGRLIEPQMVPSRSALGLGSEFSAEAV